MDASAFPLNIYSHINLIDDPLAETCMYLYKINWQISTIAHSSQVLYTGDMYQYDQHTAMAKNSASAYSYIVREIEDASAHQVNSAISES